MLNHSVIMGRICHDLEVKITPQQHKVLSFTVAIPRNYVAENKERQSDFIMCVAWNKQAEFICKYFGKGRLIALEGAMRSRVYEDKNSVNHYITELYVSRVNFTGEPKQNSQSGYNSLPPAEQSFNANSQINSVPDYDPELLSENGVPF